MHNRGFHPYWRFALCWLGLVLLAACNAPGVGPTPGSVHGNIPTGTPSLPPTAAPSLTPTSYPCPMPTQELPPRVAPVTSPTTELSQVVHILPGNFDQATVETESGTFTAPFKGGDGANVTVNLLPNTVHRLQVTVHVRQGSDNHGCTYGGYTMTTFVDQNGQALEIIQGAPTTPSPASEALGPRNIDRLKLLAGVALTDQQRAWSAIFAPDDTLLTFGFGQGVRRWQAPSGKALGDQLLNQEWMTTSAALSQDGNWMATGSGGFDSGNDNQTSVRLWNLKTGEVRLLGHHPSVVESLAFDPSSTLLASGGNDNTVFVWDVASGKKVASFTGDVAKLSDGSSLIQGMRQLFWMDGSTVLARADAVIYAWKVPSGERQLELPGEFKHMDFYLPGNLLAAVRADGVYLRDAATGKMLPLDDGSGGSRGYNQVAFNPDGTLLAALSAQQVTFWDMASKKVVASAKNPAGVPLVFSPDWRYLAQISWEKQNFSLWGVQP